MNQFRLLIDEKYQLRTINNESHNWKIFWFIHLLSFSKYLILFLVSSSSISGKDHSRTLRSYVFKTEKKQIASHWIRTRSALSNQLYANYLYSLLFHTSFLFYYWIWIHWGYSNTISLTLAKRYHFSNHIHVFHSQNFHHVNLYLYQEKNWYNSYF